MACHPRLAIAFFILIDSVYNEYGTSLGDAREYFDTATDVRRY